MQRKLPAPLNNIDKRHANWGEPEFIPAFLFAGKNDYFEQNEIV